MIVNELMDEKEAATLLHCTVAFLRRRRLFRRDPIFAKSGRLVRYRLEDLQVFIAASLQGQMA